MTHEQFEKADRNFIGLEKNRKCMSLPFTISMMDLAV